MIDTSSIPEELQSTAEFKSSYADMFAKVNAPGFIEALCAHEAAHVVYYELIAPIIYEPLKPELRYNAQAGRYEGHFAALNITEYPMFPGGSVQDFVTWFGKMMQAKVAGGVVGRKLYPSSDGGDLGDKRECEKFCEDLRRQYPNLQIDVDERWRQARAAVEGQIETSPLILEGIQQKAIELRRAFGF
jgi:hypothetical protein